MQMLLNWAFVSMVPGSPVAALPSVLRSGPAGRAAGPSLTRQRPGSRARGLSLGRWEDHGCHGHVVVH